MEYDAIIFGIFGSANVSVPFQHVVLQGKSSNTVERSLADLLKITSKARKGEFLLLVLGQRDTLGIGVLERFCSSNSSGNVLLAGIVR